MMTVAEATKAAPEHGAIKLRVSGDAIATLESISSQCGLQTLTGGRFEKAFRLAEGVRLMRNALTPAVMENIMLLQGTKLGFRTDKDASGGYNVEQVKECFIEATLRGASCFGNEFNIIAGNCYLTKEFFVRALRELPGLTNLELMPGVPSMSPNGALVPFVATWTYYGRPGSMARVAKKVGDNVEDTRICVKVNNGMGADAILGKAERKIRAAIYAQLTGTQLDDGDVDERTLVIEQASPPVSKSDALAERMGGQTQSAELKSESPTATRTTNKSNPEPLEGLGDELAEASSLSAVNIVAANFGAQCTTDAERLALQQACDARREQIRTARQK